MSGGWRRAPSSAADRGYGPEHTSQRAQLAPIVASGRAMCAEVICLMPSRRIDPGEPWALGHTPDRSGWVGPCHVKCNEFEASRRGGQAAGAQAKRRAAAKYRPREVHPGLKEA